MEPATSPDAILYWRPGCGYCAALRRRLRKAGATIPEVNIWDDRTAAAVVRLVAHGNETVPTVVIAGRALVNPSAATVLDTLRSVAPELLPPPGTAPPPRRWRRR